MKRIGALGVTLAAAGPLGKVVAQSCYTSAVLDTYARISTYSSTDTVNYYGSTNLYSSDCCYTSCY